MKIKLTKKWTNRPQPNHSTSYALWKDIYLACVKSAWVENKWSGIVYLGPFQRTGGLRRSKRVAQQDAEKLAVELLRDIRDGAKALMKRHGIGEDD